MLSKNDVSSFAKNLEQQVLRRNPKNTVCIAEEGFVMGDKTVKYLEVTIVLPYEEEEQNNVRA